MTAARGALVICGPTVVVHVPAKSFESTTTSMGVVDNEAGSFGSFMVTIGVGIGINIRKHYEDSNKENAQLRVRQICTRSTLPVPLYPESVMPCVIMHLITYIQVNCSIVQVGRPGIEAAARRLFLSR